MGGHGHLSDDKFLETLGGHSGRIAGILLAWGSHGEWLRSGQSFFSQAGLVLQASLCWQEWKLMPGWEPYIRRYVWSKAPAGEMITNENKKGTTLQKHRVVNCRARPRKGRMAPLVPCRALHSESRLPVAA